MGFPCSWLPFLVLTLQIPGAINDAVQTPLHQVNGVLGRSVLLSVNSISPSEKVAKVEWDFQPQNGKGLFVAELRDGKLERPDPKDWFGPRLEVVNETTLRIQNLKKGDSGLYKVRVRLHPAKIEQHSFCLTIYDPVPEPQILLLQESFDSSSWCNMTLQCLVSEKAGLNVSWRIRDALEPLEGSLDWYRLSSEGWHLHLSNPMDSNVTCLVSNLADQKSASVNLTGTCLHQGPQSCFSWVRITFAIGLVFEISIVMFLNLLERRDRVQEG
ncbi:T-lymphocyte surface antigen Ly-9-like [Sceloporus undulatus]|uniref:T-lymphocyte surface antigen Ly-9-like n=1 Tax=Sceloporus undulatus TaxID=8520 RepID=UPI001C4B6CCE|nr:T-lymphocyte surface antigen Ly-9-like [Sceloporus undulatus]